MSLRPSFTASAWTAVRIKALLSIKVKCFAINWPSSLPARSLAMPRHVIRNLSGRRAMLANGRASLSKRWGANPILHLRPGIGSGTFWLASSHISLKPSELSMSLTADFLPRRMAFMMLWADGLIRKQGRRRQDRRLCALSRERSLHSGRLFPSPAISFKAFWSAGQPSAQTPLIASRTVLSRVASRLPTGPRLGASQSCVQNRLKDLFKAALMEAAEPFTLRSNPNTPRVLSKVSGWQVWKRMSMSLCLLSWAMLAQQPGTKEDLQTSFCASAMVHNFLWLRSHSWGRSCPSRSNSISAFLFLPSKWWRGLEASILGAAIHTAPSAGFRTLLPALSNSWASGFQGPETLERPLEESERGLSGRSLNFFKSWGSDIAAWMLRRCFADWQWFFTVCLIGWDTLYSPHRHCMPNALQARQPKAKGSVRTPSHEYRCPWCSNAAASSQERRRLSNNFS